MHAVLVTVPGDPAKIDQWMCHIMTLDVSAEAYQFSTALTTKPKHTVTPFENNQRWWHTVSETSVVACTSTFPPTKVPIQSR